MKEKIQIIREPRSLGSRDRKQASNYYICAWWGPNRSKLNEPGTNIDKLPAVFVTLDAC